MANRGHYGACQESLDSYSESIQTARAERKAEMELAEAVAREALGQGKCVEINEEMKRITGRSSTDLAEVFD